MEMNDGHWRAKHKQQILMPMRNMNFVLFRCPSKHILIMGKSPPPPPTNFPFQDMSERRA